MGLNWRNNGLIKALGFRIPLFRKGTACRPVSSLGHEVSLALLMITEKKRVRWGNRRNFSQDSLPLKDLLVSRSVNWGKAFQNFDISWGETMLVCSLKSPCDLLCKPAAGSESVSTFWLKFAQGMVSLCLLRENVFFEMQDIWDEKSCHSLFSKQALVLLFS